MIGSFLTRGLVMVFGYAYPAYECYKTVEKNKPEIEQLRFWCQYWILVAVLTVCERIGDAFISWVPMYNEAKLAFVIYLWYPKTKGTTYVYDSFFRPYVAKHENDIDRNLFELRTRAGDMAILYWQRASSYGQTRVFEILQYIASQSTPRPQPQGARARQAPPVPNRQPPNVPVRQPSTAAQPQTEEPPSPTSGTSSSKKQMEVVGEVGPSQVPPAAAPIAALNTLKPTVVFETKGQSTTNEAETKQIEAVPSSANQNADPATEDTIMEEGFQVAHARLRKARSAEKS
ncbi:HVA22-like protein i [Tripterygium wilfordii]|uniref:HVA22-like protein n=2 Tax=Tripterygium wilfordii TaxID=458696 RepID=A0A7J7DLC9_TRIWF|nr:putative HVA22-like protein g isoform X2 [Tripterygium wilfordii]XP_038704461.1 putative HVA22-like protein g isoform X2 [Tripterygium wilfordii]XP_038704462.1 putative HVA22-like protein g isoform X2 [Tripterygium wilfordii]KAF5747170.1 HVA22-like protein i [Tripterygium wilfordii]